MDDFWGFRTMHNYKRAKRVSMESIFILDLPEVITIHVFSTKKIVVVTDVMHVFSRIILPMVITI